MLHTPRRHRGGSSVLLFPGGDRPWRPAIPGRRRAPALCHPWRGARPWPVRQIFHSFLGEGAPYEIGDQILLGSSFASGWIRWSANTLKPNVSRTPGCG